MRYIILLAMIVCCGAGCDKTPQYAIPDVYTDFVLRLDLPEYAALQTVGGWVYITTDQAQVPVGYRGIWVHRAAAQEYRAFDRACSYLPTEACHIISVDSISSVLLGCGCCASKYDFGGAPVNPPAPLPLKGYQTFYSPTNNQLRISNF